MATIAPPPPSERKRSTTPATPGGRGPLGPPDRGNGGEGPTGGGAASDRRYYTGMWVGLAGIVMLFTAFSSAYVVRQGLGGDWQPIEFPGVVWVNTVVLLLSSVTIEFARRSLAHPTSCRRWWAVTSLLGVVFLCGQFLVWRQLAAAGVFIDTNPSSSFFYVLTGAHAIHLAGGLAALFWLGVRLWRNRLSRVAADLTSLYWHFMDGLWVYLLLLLSIWR